METEELPSFTDGRLLMISPLKRQSVSGRGTAGYLACWPGLLLLLAGCHAPPAHPNTEGQSRALALTCQVAQDTALKVVIHPIDTTTQVAEGTVAYASLASREFLAKRYLIPCGGHAPPLVEDRGSLDPTELDQDFFKLTRVWRKPARIEMDVDGEAALRRLEGLIDHAQQSLDVLMYQWDNDALGWGLAHRLADRALSLPSPPGCPAVRILIDGGGNLIHAPPESARVSEANEVVGWLSKQPHVEVLRTRNPLAHFDHRKLVVIDRKIAWSGGRNFTLASFFEYHDVSYTLEGPLVAEMEHGFEETWEQSGGLARPPVATPELDEAEANALCRVVGTSATRRDLSRVLYRAVDRSYHHVYLENPYFTDSLLWCKLARARRRGSDVRVVFAKDSQSCVIDRAVRVTVNRLLRIGVRVYMHPSTTHVKAASVDTRWAYLGTGNFDNLSLRRNNEVGVSIGSGPLIDEVEERVFLRDFRRDWEIKEPLDVNLGDYLCEVIANIIL
jgi:phosphatidylserine/phosphatidylglycerophosphate/cardiolipin synthase-like enzyme